jgi:hypothetical protein
MAQRNIIYHYRTVQGGAAPAAPAAMLPENNAREIGEQGVHKIAHRDTIAV